jgi:hypothetical protein
MSDGLGRVSHINYTLLHIVQLVLTCTKEREWDVIWRSGLIN